MNFHTSLRIVAPVLALAFVTACGKKEAVSQTSQVAARVNAEEITVNQINNILASSVDVSPENARLAGHDVLERLIDQRLAKQYAIDAKLDRLPNVIKAIEDARSEILARAYVDRVAAALPDPASADIRKFYLQHPELFAQRRIFDLEVIQVVPKKGLATKLQRQLEKVDSMAGVTAWLTSQGATFAANRGVRAAEQIPMEALSRLHAMSDGTIFLMESADHLNVFHVVGTRIAPVDEVTAAPRIRQFLINRSSSEWIAVELKKIKAKADIVYLGEFARDATADKASPAGTFDLPLQARSQAPSTESQVQNLR